MRPDEILLLDMLLAAEEAGEFLRGLSMEAFRNDRLRQLAVIKSIEVVGEAASRISEEYRAAHPQIPWREIIGMRNRLTHGYFEINPHPGLANRTRRLTSARDDSRKAGTTGRIGRVTVSGARAGPNQARYPPAPCRKG